MSWRWATKGDLAAMQQAILKAVTQTKGEIMSTVNTAAADLQAGEAELEKDVATLGTTLTTAFADLKATIAADLNAAGVPSEVVDGVTAKLGTLDGVIQQFTAQAVAADPGAPAAPAA